MLVLLTQYYSYNIIDIVYVDTIVYNIRRISADESQKVGLFIVSIVLLASAGMRGKEEFLPYFIIYSYIKRML